MVKVYTKEHNAAKRIKDSPYAGSARILGYDKLQCDCGLKVSRKHRMPRSHGENVESWVKLLPLLLASVSLLGCLVAHFMVLHSMYYLSTQRQHPQIK